MSSVALERKVVSALVRESQEKHNSITDRHDMAITVRTASKPNTNKQIEEIKLLQKPPFTELGPIYDILTLSQRQVLDPSKLNEHEDNFKFDKNCKKCSDGIEKETLLGTSNLCFSHRVFGYLFGKHVQTRDCLRNV